MQGRANIPGMLEAMRIKEPHEQKKGGAEFGSPFWLSKWLEDELGNQLHDASIVAEGL